MLGAGAAKIYASRFDTLVSHEVGEERYVVEFFQKVLCETMAKRVMINDRGVQLVLDGELLQLGCDPSCSDSFASMIDEDEP